jgi:DNA-binding transcriptional regulator LsrR (DeoR family)
VVERKKLAERRARALYLSAVRGLTVGEIGIVLKVSERTVTRDLKAARQRAMAELQSEAETAERITDLAVDIDAALSAVSREAWVSVGASDATSPQHVRALNTALAAVARRAEVLQSLGLLKKVPDKMALTFDPIGLSDEEIKQLLEQAQQQKED